MNLHTTYTINTDLDLDSLLLQLDEGQVVVDWDVLDAYDVLDRDWDELNV